MRQNSDGHPQRSLRVVAAAGRYHVTGRSPLMQSGLMICGATTGLLVTRGKAAGQLTVICSIP